MSAGRSVAPAHAVPEGALGVEPSGVVLGRDSAGRAVLVRLFGPDPMSVAFVGGWWAARLLVFRCLAHGASVTARAYDPADPARAGAVADTAHWLALDDLSGRAGLVTLATPGASPRPAQGAGAPTAQGASPRTAKGVGAPTAQGAGPRTAQGAGPRPAEGAGPRTAQDAGPRTAPGAGPRSATAARPLLEALDLGPAVPPGRRGPWHTRLAVLREVTPAAVPLLADADVLIVQRLPAPQAALLGSALGVRGDLASRLPAMDDEMVAVLGAGSVRYSWLTPTPIERRLFG